MSKINALGLNVALSSADAVNRRFVGLNLASFESIGTFVLNRDISDWYKNEGLTDPVTEDDDPIRGIDLGSYGQLRVPEGCNPPIAVLDNSGYWLVSMEDEMQKLLYPNSGTYTHYRALASGELIRSVNVEGPFTISGTFALMYITREPLPRPNEIDLARLFKYITDLILGAVGSNWILETGYWNDAGAWNDDDVWKDG